MNKKYFWGLVFLVGLQGNGMAFNLPKIIKGTFSSPPPASSNICLSHIASIEKRESIPNQLLNAIAHVESGRWNRSKKKVEPWPWSVHAEGKGYFLANKGEAIQLVKSLLNRGITNIDVGCMQINIEHHGKAFETLSQMFDPAYNVAYAAKFLKSLRRKRASWAHAIAHYHSATPLHHIPYRKKVYDAWMKSKEGNGVPFEADEALFYQRAYDQHQQGKLLKVRDPKLYGLVGARRLIRGPKAGKQAYGVQQIAYRRPLMRPMVIDVQKARSLLNAPSRAKRKQYP